MALRTQETMWLQGTAVTNADKQDIGVSSSPKAAALDRVEGCGSKQLTGTGTTLTGAQVEHGRCARATRCRTLVESADEAASSQAASAIVRNAVAGAVASAHNLTTMATVVVAMGAEFSTPCEEVS